MAVRIEQVDAREHREELVRLYRADGNRFFGRVFDWYYSDSGGRRPAT